MAVSEDVAAGRTQRPGTDRGAFIGTPGLTIVRTACLQRHFQLPAPCVSIQFFGPRGVRLRWAAAKACIANRRCARALALTVMRFRPAYSRVPGEWDVPV
jgi:hypothetical protein